MPFYNPFPVITARYVRAEDQQEPPHQIKPVAENRDHGTPQRVQPQQRGPQHSISASRRGQEALLRDAEETQRICLRSF